MGSTLKSVRIDDEVLSIAEDFLKLNKESLGIGSTFSNLVNNAISEYIVRQITNWSAIIGGLKEFTYPDEKGRFHTYPLSEELFDQYRSILYRAMKDAGYFEEGKVISVEKTPYDVLDYRVVEDHKK